MSDEMSVFLSLDSATLQRRIDNMKLIIGALTREADSINSILDQIEAGTIDSFLKRKESELKEFHAKLSRLELAKTVKELKG